MILRHYDSEYLHVITVMETWDADFIKIVSTEVGEGGEMGDIVVKS